MKRFRMQTLCAVLGLALTVQAQEQSVRVYTSTTSGLLMNKKEYNLRQGTVPNSLIMRPAVRYQTMDGFGAAITYSSCYNLLKMNAAERAKFLEQTYSPNKGYGFSYARISIGCNDFSSTEFTCCDKKGSQLNPLYYFDLPSDDKDYVIPILQQILALNPDLKIIGSPWTCPRWMKVEDITTKKLKYSWTDGHLNPDYYSAYADYFVKWIQAMKENGIPIYAVTPQNEPLNRYNCASLYMPWEEEAAFVKVLAKRFKEKGITTKIYLFDHNYNYDNMAAQNDYPIKVYNELGESEGSELVVGAAYHDYGGNASELDDIHNQNPDKDLIFSESSIGTWNDGRNLNSRLMADMNNTVLGTVNRYCRAVLVWNLMLDSNRGPNLDGGCQTCYGAVDISADDYSTLTYNSHYYILSHIASVVKPDAVRIGNNVLSISGLSYATFLNPDGTHAAILCNNSNTARTVPVSNGTAYYTCTIPANGIVSVQFRTETAQEEVVPTIDGTTMTSGGADVYYRYGSLVQGQTYRMAGRAEVNASDWYYDPDFFTANADGTFTFRAVSGNYRWEADFLNRCFRVYAMQNSTTKASMGTDGSGGLWVIGNNKVGKPNYATGNSNWSPDKAMCMAEVSPGIYTYTLTVGRQLDANSVNFKFFHQANWGNEFVGANGPYLLTCESDLFGVGTGDNGHDNGNIYKKTDAALTVGDTYIFTVDATDKTQARLTVTKNNKVGIDAAQTDAAGTGDNLIYDTEGRVRGTTLQALPHGIYIQNGRKVVK